MLKIDALAHTNALKKLPTPEKAVFAIFAIVFVTASKSITAAIIIFVVNFLLTVYMAKIPFVTYLKLLSVPAGFIFVTAITLLTSFHGLMPYVNLNNLAQVKLLLATSLAGISAMYFLALTTPFINLAEFFIKLRLPQVLVELMLLIYRFIFVMLEVSFAITTAQRARLGYEGLRNGYRSLALLIGNLFINAYRRSNQLFLAMTARNYTGTITVLLTEEKISPLRAIWIAIYFGALTALVMVGGK